MSSCKININLAEDYQPKNESFTIFPSCHSNLHDEDELSFLNSSIPLLPPPMPSLRVLSRIHLPFQAPAPKACSTPNLTMLSSPPKSFEQDGEKVDLEERERESHRKPQVGNKQGHKAVKKNARAKEIMSKRRQKKWKVVEKPVIIDVEKYQPPPKSQSEKLWIRELNLFERDREILLSPTGLLTDNIIDAAQTLLRQAFPVLSGLQSVTCGLTMNFDIEPAEFVQIIHNGRGHWLTISTIGTSHPDVHVYDSMYPSAGTLVKAQTAALLHTESPAIHLKFMSVQMQAGGYDCGLFAVAFAVALAFGNPPGQFHFEQQKMRHHLWKCFENRKINMFPYNKLQRATELTVKSVEEVPIYCICRMPELPNTKWIECSRCKKWFHTETCICVPPKALVASTRWFCSMCE